MRLKESISYLLKIAFGMNIDSINNDKDKIFNDYMNEVLIITGDLFKKPLTRVSFLFVSLETRKSEND